MDEVYRNRWRTLLSVDEMVESVIEKLQSLSILNETYVIFTSDHGYHMGTFALTIDKRMPYETGIYYTFYLLTFKVPIANHSILNFNQKIHGSIFGCNHSR